MDPQFRTSFIPKKPITSAAVRSPSTINLFSLLATVLFIVALALSGAVFFYDRIVVQQIASDKASLDRAKGAFEPDLINKIVRLDSRIESGKKLMTSHLAVTPFFDFLASVTLRPVRFNDFDFSYLTPSKILVTMKGQAASYAAVALESDLLNAQKQLKNTVISDMALDQTGLVTFSLTTTVDPSLVSFSSSIAAGAAPAAEAIAPVVTTASSTPTASSTKQ